MPRMVDEGLHASRRDAILTGAAEIVADKGYERTTVQDVITHVRISKGAFYHYFDSKPALLEALVERMTEQLAVPLTEVVRAPDTAADAKLQTFFLTLTRRKARARPLLSAILSAWYADSNAVVRQKLRVLSTERFGPLLAEIVSQGTREGVFRVSDPERTGEIVWCLAQDLVDGLSRVFLTGGDPLPESRERIDATTEAVRRVLGTSADLRLIDDEVVLAWIREVER